MAVLRTKTTKWFMIFWVWGEKRFETKHTNYTHYRNNEWSRTPTLKSLMLDEVSNGWHQNFPMNRLIINFPKKRTKTNFCFTKFSNSSRFLMSFMLHRFQHGKKSNFIYIKKVNCAFLIELYHCCFYWTLRIKRNVLFLNCINIKLDADSSIQLSPNLTLTNSNSPNKFATEFMTPRLTNTEFYCTYEVILLDRRRLKAT